MNRIEELYSYNPEQLPSIIVHDSLNKDELDTHVTALRLQMGRTRIQNTVVANSKQTETTPPGKSIEMQVAKVLADLKQRLLDTQITAAAREEALMTQLGEVQMILQLERVRFHKREAELMVQAVETSREVL